MKRQPHSIYLPPLPRTVAAAVFAACAALAAGHVAAATAPGAPAGAAARVNLTTSGGQHQASVASDADGDAVIAYYSAPAWPAAQGIRARRLDAAGLPLGGEIIVNGTPLYGSMGDPEVATDKDGNFSVVWANLGATPGSVPHIYRRRFDAAGNALGAELRLDGPANIEAASPHIAMNASGASVVAWYGYGGGTHLRVQRYDASGTAVGSEITVATMATVNYGPQIRVAMDDTGRFSVIWTEDKNDGANFDVYRRHYDATGTAQGPTQRVNSAISGSQRKADIAMDAAGNSVVIWDSAISSTNVRVVGQRYGSNGFATGSEFVLAYYQFLEKDPMHPAVSMARATGEFAASWRRRDGQVYLRRYSAAGVDHGAEVAASSVGTGNMYPRLASDADGDVSLIWRDDESGASNDFGVMTRRYAGQPSINLTADLTGLVDTSTPPTALAYTVAVSNLQPANAVPGLASATGIVALLTPPADASLISASGSNWYCITAATPLRCSYLVPLPAGASAAPLQLRYAAGANPAPQASVQVAGNQYDATPANDSDTLPLNLP